MYVTGIVVRTGSNWRQQYDDFTRNTPMSRYYVPRRLVCSLSWRRAGSSCELAETKATFLYVFFLFFLNTHAFTRMHALKFLQQQWLCFISIKISSPITKTTSCVNYEIDRTAQIECSYILVWIWVLLPLLVPNRMNFTQITM